MLRTAFAQLSDYDYQRIQILTDKAMNLNNLGSQSSGQVAVNYYLKAIEVYEEMLRILSKDAMFQEMSSQLKEQVRLAKIAMASAVSSSDPLKQQPVNNSVMPSSGLNPVPNLDEDIQRIQKSQINTSAEIAPVRNKDVPKKSEEVLRRDYEIKKYEKSMEMQSVKNKLIENINRQSLEISSKSEIASCLNKSESQVAVGNQPISSEICEFSLGKSGRWTKWFDIGNGISISYCPLIIKNPISLGLQINSIQDYGFYRFLNSNMKNIIVSGQMKFTYLDAQGALQDWTEPFYFDSEDKKIIQDLGMHYLGFTIASIEWINIKCSQKK